LCIENENLVIFHEVTDFLQFKSGMIFNKFNLHANLLDMQEEYTFIITAINSFLQIRIEDYSSHRMAICSAGFCMYPACFRNLHPLPDQIYICLARGPDTLG